MSNPQRTPDPRRVADDDDDGEDMGGPLPIFPRVCTWCAHWKPADGQRCEAFPKGGRYPIPEALYRGRIDASTGYGHLLLIGHDRNGIHFKLTPQAKVSPPWLAEAQAKARAAAAAAKPAK